MQSVDPDGALKMYAQSGDWDKCIQLAHKQVDSLSTGVAPVVIMALCI